MVKLFHIKINLPSPQKHADIKGWQLEYGCHPLKTTWNLLRSSRKNHVDFPDVPEVLVLAFKASKFRRGVRKFVKFLAVSG